MGRPASPSVLAQVLGAAADALDGPFARQGGAWALPFVGVAIDRARSFPAPSADAAQDIWYDLEQSAKTLRFLREFRHVVLSAVVRAIGCRLLFAGILGSVGDDEARDELSDSIERVLVHGKLDARLAECLDVVSPGDCVRKLLAALPDASSIVDVVDLVDQQRAGRHQRYRYLGVLVPYALQSSLERLQCAVGSLVELAPSDAHYRIRLTASSPGLSDMVAVLQEFCVRVLHAPSTVWLESVLGRISRIKRVALRMFRALKASVWASAFRKRRDELYSRLLSCRTAIQVAGLVQWAADHITVIALSSEWFNTINVAFNSFFLCVCLIVLDGMLPDGAFEDSESETREWLEDLYTLRRWHTSNSSVRSTRSVLAAFEDHLDPDVMRQTWVSDRLLWQRVVAIQTTDDGIRACIDSLLAAFLKPVKLAHSSRAAASTLIALDCILPDSAFNPNWFRIRALSRLSLRSSPVSTQVRVAVCLATLVQNTVRDGVYHSTDVCDYVALCDFETLRRALVSVAQSCNVDAFEPNWVDHKAVWLEAVDRASSAGDLSEPVLNLMLFMNNAPDSQRLLSHYFHQLRETWEMALLACDDAVECAQPLDHALDYVDEDDIVAARRLRIDLWLDELEPLGLRRCLDWEHAAIDNALSFADLGMGLGRAILRTYLSCTSLRKCIGVEASGNRFKTTVAALRQWPGLEVVVDVPAACVVADRDQRILDLRCGDLFDCEDGIQSDVVLLYIRLYPAMRRRLCRFVVTMRPGARLITNIDIVSLFLAVFDEPAPFEQVAINRSTFDCFRTKAAPVSGQRLLIYRRLPIVS
ncbi:unnamed protein product (mitochondrion) [Plasmodiophora brassicae]|uniref:Uncharacterized protein n=1 Tax=Plasmodiophora brassicae TaxID=37360 RepID=A0A3P3XYN9_PLABS|nr:unnamed protein product [Plasmodiophora brassicae]